MRYEHAGKFWSIRRLGTALTIVQGKIGNKGRITVKHFATEGASISAHDQLVLEKQREGFRIAAEPDEPAPASAPVPDEDTRGAALEAAIAGDPDDANAYAVYGDWLQRHGDPRGELVALMQAASPKTAAATGKHLAENATQLLGPFASLVADVRVTEGPPFWWKHGFIRRAELASLKGRPVDATVANFFAHPSAKFLVELAVRADDRKEALGTLGALKDSPASLRDFDLFARANLDRLDPMLWKSLPPLRALGITARAFALAHFAMPSLVRAKFRATSMAAESIAAIAAAPWPNLERLEIRFCSRTGSTEADLHDLRPLLQRTDMPALTQLKLKGCPFAGAAARVIATSQLGRQLRILDFSHGNFTPNDTRELGKLTFPNLVELWLPMACITITTQPILAKLAKHLVPDTRGPVDMLDYDLAGER